INSFVFANDPVEDDIEVSDIESILLENATAEAEKEPSINSRHGVVYDRASGKILYGKKENEKCKMASTTKIMTAVIVLETEKNLEEKVKVSSKAAGTGGSRLGLKKDDEISVNDLIYGLLLCSRK
ncbi:MAG: serine hydrolase, partial [Clostridia bacterium]|nr:serine hydrolase [Clostridia bacterium]